jgi:hypothetical protein
MPPPHTRWFNICLCGPAEDRLVLSPPDRSGNVIWLTKVPTNHFKLYVWEVALLARTIHTHLFPSVLANCYLFAGYCAHVLHNYLLENNQGITGVGKVGDPSQILNPVKRSCCLCWQNSRRKLGRFERRYMVFFSIFVNYN